MDRDSIDRVEIDAQGRLHVSPHAADFPFIYRAGMEIGWDTRTRSLHSPRPREWTYERWYRQIIAAAAQEYRCQLFLTVLTEWINVDAGTKAEVIAAHGNGA